MFCLCRFVWFKIVKLCDAITLAVIGVFIQFKKFCNGLEEEKTIIERFNFRIHHHHFHAPLHLTSSIHLYSSLLQLTCTTATNHRYISPLQLTAKIHRCTSSLQFIFTSHRFNLPPQISVHYAATIHLYNSILQFIVTSHSLNLPLQFTTMN
jgi:hypothetical protein